MNLDLTPEEQSLRDRARTFARDHIRSHAASIDRHAVVPGDLLRDIEQAQLIPAGGSALVAVVEEIAVESASAAAAAAFRASPHVTKLDSPGLRGVAVPQGDETRARLVLAAVALGVGRCAIETAIDVLGAAPHPDAQSPRVGGPAPHPNAQSPRVGGPASAGQHDSEKPHWVLADAATEVDAARLLAYEAAHRLDRDGDAAAAAAAGAKLAAGTAALRAVDAALRIVGPDGYAPGTLLERLTRDARALTLVLGTEEHLRATVATEWFGDPTRG